MNSTIIYIFDIVMILIIPSIIFTITYCVNMKKTDDQKKYEEAVNTKYRRGQKDFIASSPQATFYEEYYRYYDCYNMIDYYQIRTLILDYIFFYFFIKTFFIILRYYFGNN
jgi:hypothetical protein